MVFEQRFIIKIMAKIVKYDLVREYVNKYIQLSLLNKTQYSKRFIATVIQAENPELYKTVEAARFDIRTVLQRAGNKMSKKDNDLAEQFALIQSEVRDTVNENPFVFLTAIKKTLWIADLHGLFYNKKALEMALDYGIKQNCDSICILGDYLDFYQDSKFDKNPLITKIFEEQEWGQDMLRIFQDNFNYVVLKEGNHDIRRELHIARLSATKPELMNMSKYSDYLFFDGCNVNFVEDYRHLVYGKLNAIHGHEYYGGGGIHVAHNRLAKSFANIISAHSHKAQSIIRKDINSNVIGSWALGCMCGLNPRYSPKNDWNNGFAITEKDTLGDFCLENKVIFNNKIFSV